MTRLTVSLLAVCVLASHARSDGPKPPNVVLIVSDDQAWTDFGFMGHEHIRTPRIDRLASEGLRFRHGYVPSSLCSPSLISILTGLYPHQHRVTSNDPPAVTRQEVAKKKAARSDRSEILRLFDDQPSLPRKLGELGYVSLQTGKWWGGNYRRGGFTQGMTHGELGPGGRHGDEGLTIGRETMEPLTRFIDQAVADEKPFFVWYAPMLPHQPHNPPERLLKKYRDIAPTLPIAKYWAMCEWFDETVGTLLDHLDAKGLADTTLVAFVVDNGWIQEPDADRFAARSKQSPYDGGLRTPILLRWPGHIEPKVIDTPVSSIDLAPTILKACGAEAMTRGLPGLDLLDREAVDSRDAIFGEIFTHNAVDLKEPASSLRFRWVISEGWKLIVPDPVNEPKARVELFHLATDPFEKSEDSENEPAVVAALKAKLNAWWPGR
jgi:uncharacterized sulfatase